jgi:hypothetical protein
MTQSQWTAAMMFGVVIALIGATWRFYAEGFSWRVAAIVVMVVLILANHLRHRRRKFQRQP